MDILEFNINYQLILSVIGTITGISYSPVFLAPGQGKPFVQEI